MIGLVPQRCPPRRSRRCGNTVSFSRGLFGKPANPGHIESVLKSLHLWDKKTTR